MRVRPLFDCVLVREEPPAPSGPIIIADRWRSPPVEGVVVATGPGAPLPDGSSRPVQVSVGQRVIWNHGSGEPVELDDGNGRVLREDAILAVLDT